MMILYSPVRSDNKIDYKVNGNEITCILNNEQYGVYNVSELEGMNPFHYNEFMPIRSVFKDEQGEFWVKLIYYHGIDATEEERFPDWFEVI